MAVTYPCPHCGERLTVDEGRRGKSYVCDLCGQASLVPGATGQQAEAPEPPAPSRPSPPPARESPPAPARARRGLPWAILVPVLFVALFVGWWAYQLRAVNVWKGEVIAELDALSATTEVALNVMEYGERIRDTKAELARLRSRAPWGQGDSLFWRGVDEVMADHELVYDVWHYKITDEGFVPANTPLSRRIAERWPYPGTQLCDELVQIGWVRAAQRQAALVEL